MSDHPNAAASISEQLGLGRCPSTSWCECPKHAEESSHRTTGSSSSRSRSRSSGEEGSRDSKEKSDEYFIAPAESESFIPDAIVETDWRGLEDLDIGNYHHGRPAIVKRAWDGKYTAHRFLGCPMEDEGEQCMFIEWLDDPWPRQLQDSLKKLWHELRMTRRCNETSNDALIDALRFNNIANDARMKLQDEVVRTKRIADCAMAIYQKHAADVVVDKSKLMYLVYCLLGVISFLVNALWLLLIKK